jgi:PAS domain S-box-containing protein
MARPSSFSGRVVVGLLRVGMKVEIFRFERCEVHVHRRQVALNGLDQPIEPLPFDLLVFLIRTRGHVVSKDQLIEHVWKSRYVSDGVIATAIQKARRAIGDHGSRPSVIVTSRRRGYCFVAEVQETGDADPMAWMQDHRVSDRLERLLEQPLGKRREVTGLLHALMLADQDAALSLAARLLGQKKAGRAAVTQAAVHHALGRIHEGRGNHQTARLHLAHAHRLVDTRGLPVQLSGLLDEERGTKSVIDELRSANAALFSMIDSMPDPVFVKDQDHRWVFLNHEFCRLVGQQREALLGKSDYDFFPERQADVFWRMDDMVFQSRTENVNEETITKPSGETYTVTSKKKLFIDHSQEIYLIGTLSFSR